MKICHLINSYPLATGGMQSYCYDLAEIQSKREHDVYVYVSGVINKSAFSKRFKVKNFNERRYGMGMALTMIDKGFNILYQPLAIVNHSHDTSTINLFKRYFDFGVSHSGMGNAKNKSKFVGKGFSIFMDELKYLIVKGQITWIPKAFHIFAH